ncbi:MAG: type I methionyl aminopeptidase [Elusimicrobiota bacterium]
MIDLKNEHELNIMRRCGSLLSRIACRLMDEIADGISTYDLDRISEEEFKKKRLKPAFLNYGNPPFKGRICASINEEIVHGLPSKKKRVKNGDIISIDLGGVLEGFYTDMAFTRGVGRIKKSTKKLIDTTREALRQGTENMKEGNRLYDISYSIQQVAEDAGYSVVRDLVGHGVGKDLHEYPRVPNFGKKGKGPLLKTGMVFALEPMLNEGGSQIVCMDDEWTVATADGRLSCHFENTVALTSGGPESITNISEKFYD